MKTRYDLIKWCEQTRIVTIGLVLYTNIDQTLVNSLHGLLNCEIVGLDCHVNYNSVQNTCPLYTHVTPIL